MKRTSVRARDLKPGMRLGFLNLFRIRTVAETTAGDIYYTYGRTTQRRKGNALVEVSIR